VDSHEKTIFDKVTIILNHFVSKTSKKINGRGRGMVVVRSRKHCVLFHEEMVKQMKERHLSYSCLVAYSGSIYHNGRENTETSLNTENGLVRTSIPNGLKDPRYRILIVSSKFQTGYNEPLLQSMYVDKKLSGVQCVQTLSRLNRTTKGKTDTFVLDFVNDTEEIVNSFQPYYTNTMLTEETDPDKLYDLVYEIEQFNLYTKYQVNEFCKEFYRKSDSDEKLHPIIDVVVDKFKDSLDTEQQDEFKSMIQSYIRLYSYISQISSFTEIEWEKTYVFLRFLNKKLPKGISERLSIIDSVDLDSLRIQMIGESNLSLEDKGGELDPISSGVGGMIEDEKELLSEIIEKVNSVYGIELREEDKYYLENVDKKMTENVEMKKVMLGNNSEDVKKDEYKRLFKDSMIDYTGDRMEFYKKVMDDRILPVLVDVMYNNYRKSIGNQNP
jgi:type I restriction enzyme R subunit